MGATPLKQRRFNEFTWIIAGEALLLGLIFAGQQGWLGPLALLRGVLGLAYVLFLPGYALQVFWFPRNEDLDGPERAALSFGLSIALAALLALILNYMPGGIHLWSIAAAEGVTVLLLSLAAAWRRGRVAVEERFHPQVAFDWRTFWAAQDRTAKVLYSVLGASVIVAFGLLITYFVLPSPAEFFTEFYMVGPEGLAEYYPRQASVGEPLTVTMGVTNRERTAMTYRVELWVQNGWDDSRRQQVGALGPFELPAGETVEAPLVWAMPWAGEDQRVDVLLFAGEGAEPYRRLRLWVNVK